MTLKSRPRTGPVCIVCLWISDASALRGELQAIFDRAHSPPSSILTGSQMSTSPFSMPAEITPFGLSDGCT